MVLPGEKTAAIRLAAAQVLVHAQTCQALLKRFHYSEVTDRPELNALRNFTDDVLGLYNVIDDALPQPVFSSPEIDPADGAHGIFHRVVRIRPPEATA
jgi:hypothetical protein